MFWLVPVLISLALNIVAYLLTPKPKKQKPAASQDAENPTAEAGRPMPVVFGRLTVTGPNVLWFGDKTKYDYEIKA